MSYGNVTALLADWVAATFHITTGRDRDLPSNLAYLVPYAHVQRIGGGDNTISLDVATLDVDVYASTGDAALDIAEQIRSGVRLQLPGYTAGDLTVSRTRTALGPALRDYEATSVFLAAATYQVTVHAHALAD